MKSEEHKKWRNVREGIKEKITLLSLFFFFLFSFMLQIDNNKRVQKDLSKCQK